MRRPKARRPGVYGGKEILTNLTREIRGIKNRTKAGVHAAGLLVKSRALPKTPVKTGNLRNSAYVISEDTKRGPVAEVGYTASYAVFVHEIDKNYRAPGTSWKYLERAIQESRGDILRLIRDYAGEGLSKTRIRRVRRV